MLYLVNLYSSQCGIESSLGGCLPPRSAVARPSIPDDPTGNYVLVNAKFGAPARAFDHEQGYPVVVKSTGGNAVVSASLVDILQFFIGLFTVEHLCPRTK